MRCGWFVPHPGYLLDLTAQLNCLSSSLAQAHAASLACENKLLELRKEMANAEKSGQPVPGPSSYR
jgi:hypothetical protein